MPGNIEMHNLPGFMPNNDQYIKYVETDPGTTKKSMVKLRIINLSIIIGRTNKYEGRERLIAHIDFKGLMTLPYN